MPSSLNVSTGSAITRAYRAVPGGLTAGRFPGPAAGNRRAQSENGGRATMGILDKITGKAKRAAGDVTGDPSLRREGRREERKGQAKEEISRHEERADEKPQEVAGLERRT